MSQSLGRVFVTRDAAKLGVRVEGRGTAHGCPALRQWLEAELAAGADLVQFDLAGCSHMDSTFVGTLLFLAKHRPLQGGRLVLVRPSAECLQVLKQMCVVRLFRIEDGVGVAAPVQESDGGWRELSCEVNPVTRQSFRETVVQAHEELAEVPSPLSDCFRQIAETGKKELQVYAADSPGE